MSDINKIKINGTDYGIAGVIVESGSNDNGTWTKWADGTMIVTQEFTRVITTSTTSGSMYYISLYDIPSYPVTFTKVYNTHVTIFSNNIMTANPYCNDKTLGSHLDQCCTRILIYAPEKYEEETVLFNVMAIGKWK